MSSVRLNKLYLIAGQRGTGKTTIAQKLAEASGKKVIVVDTDAHPAYDSYESIAADAASIASFDGSKGRILATDVDMVLMLLNKYQSNAFILLEDAPKYLDSNLSRATKAFIIDMRKRNFDVAIMFHSLSDIPPYLCKNYNTLIIFKVDDNLDVPQRKFNQWELIKKIATDVRKHPEWNYAKPVIK